MLQSKEIKVVLLGDSGVGKSSLLVRFVDNEFSEKGQPTLGAAFMSKTVIANEKSLKFQIWDTAGQEKYKAILPLYYRDAKVAILVFDLNDKQSFDGIIEWVKQLKEAGPIDQILAIVGNKYDLECKVDMDQVNAFVESNSALYFTISCKNNYNVQETFLKIGQKIIEEQNTNVIRQSNIENQQSALKIGNQNSEIKKSNQKQFCC